MVTSGYNLTELRDHRDVFKSVHVTGIKLDGYSLHSILKFSNSTKNTSAVRLMLYTIYEH